MLKIAAILDTDFTIKTASTENSKGDSLADVVLKLPYSFYCHEQNKKELTDHSGIASGWLEDKINSKAVICMSDLKLLKKIRDSYNCAQNYAVRFYSDWLKQSCDVFSKSFYETYYGNLEKLKNKTDEISDEEFSISEKMEPVTRQWQLENGKLKQPKNIAYYFSKLLPKATVIANTTNVNSGVGLDRPVMYKNGVYIKL